MPRLGTELGEKRRIGECGVHGHGAGYFPGLSAPFYVQERSGDQASFQGHQRGHERPVRSTPETGLGGRHRGSAYLPLHGAQTRLEDLHGQFERKRRITSQLVSDPNHAQ